MVSNIHKCQWKTSYSMVVLKHLDLIIIGAGTAGLTAALYGARSGLRTLVLEERIIGGSAAETPIIENYPGFYEGISGRELVDRMAKHCKKFGAEINELESVTKMTFKDSMATVKTEKATYTSSVVIIASGCHYKELGVPGEAEFRGRGVSYCTLCDGAFFKEKKVIVVGGGNTAAISSIYLANLASVVMVAHRRDQLRAEEALVKDMRSQNVDILWNTEVKEIKGDTKVKSVILHNNKTGKKREVDIDGVFIQVGEVPNSQVAKKAGVEVDKDGYILVDSRQRTNIEGLYAAGDITKGPVKQIGTAVGQSIIAATEAFGHIKQPYYYQR
ncbi:MAG: thioredoxin-disulfide reductase [Candidatus Bathyarchaeota archaeon]|nr:MAG: thioredoxin-disulfide reductase [Candidatus Bathyarchaeota archaeon]